MKKMKSILSLAAMIIACGATPSLLADGYAGGSYDGGCGYDMMDSYAPNDCCYQSKCGCTRCGGNYQGCYFQNPYAGCNWTPGYGSKCCDCNYSPIRSENFYTQGYGPQGGYQDGQQQRPSYFQQYRQYLERNTQQGYGYNAPQGQYGYTSTQQDRYGYNAPQGQYGFTSTQDRYSFNPQSQSGYTSTQDRSGYMQNPYYQSGSGQPTQAPMQQRQQMQPSNQPMKKQMYDQYHDQQQQQYKYEDIESYR